MRNKQVKTTREPYKISPEFDFFVHNPLTEYEGMYVAILGRKVVASGLSAKDVWDEVIKKYPKQIPTIAKLPKKENLAYRFCWGEKIFLNILILFFLRIQKQYLRNRVCGLIIYISYHFIYQ